jgi:alpha-ribazole phosphatase
MRHHRDLQQEDAENYAAWCADWQHAPPTQAGFQAFAERVRGVTVTLTTAGNLTIC